MFIMNDPNYPWTDPRRYQLQLTSVMKGNANMKW